MNKHLKYLFASIDKLPSRIKAACAVVLSDPAFESCPGGSKHHHNYKGGLVEHVAGVMKSAIIMAKGNQADLEVLIPAVVYHDYGKIWDYVLNTDGTVSTTPHKDLIYHISRSYAEWMKVAERINLPITLTLSIGHCILSHHGRRDWGSPIEPQTREALILHAADMLNSGVQ